MHKPLCIVHRLLFIEIVHIFCEQALFTGTEFMHKPLCTGFP